MIRRTSATDLAVPFVVAGALVFLILKASYGSLPPFQWFVLVPVAALAVAELVMSRRVRSAVRHDREAKPMTALAIARAVALAKASAIGAALVAGAAVGLIGVALPDANRDVSAAGHDLRIGVGLLCVAIALCGAGLLLERAGIDPNSRGNG